jgi:hypothetical protein
VENLVGTRTTFEAFGAASREAACGFATFERGAADRERCSRVLAVPGYVGVPEALSGSVET